MTYEVVLPIIRGFQVIYVEANSEEDAKNKVINGDFDEYETEYEDLEEDTDTNTWSIEEYN